jgi:hypothetical protein
MRRRRNPGDTRKRNGQSSHLIFPISKGVFMKASELAALLNATVGNPVVVIELYKDGKQIFGQDFAIDEVHIKTHSVVLQTRVWGEL